MKTKKTMNITLAIFLGLILGILFGLFMPGRYEFLLPVVELVSSLYMNALRMMIYPLVFCSLIVGIQGIGSIGSTGKIGGQAVLYFATTTLFASTLGLFLPQLLGLGKGVTIQMMESDVEAARFTSLVDTVKNLSYTIMDAQGNVAAKTPLPIPRSALSWKMSTSGMPIRSPILSPLPRNS